jgi:putative ABC transport system permease protein
MRVVKRFVVRIRNFMVSCRDDERLREEMDQHIALQTDENIRAGMPPAEARHQARLKFGSLETIREAYHVQESLPLLEHLLRDLRFSLRGLRKSPGFTSAAVVTLALGIGATTAIFTLIDQVMLSSLPVSKPQELWRVGDSADCCHSNGYTQDNAETQNDWSLFSWEAYKQFRANTPAFDHLAALELGESNAELAVRRSGSSTPVEPRNGEYVSGNFFRTFGISAWRGRLFTDADEREGAPPVAVMSFHTWQQSYGSDPSVVGAAYEINNHAFTVIGIAPPGFYGAKVSTWGMPDFWLPLTTEPLIGGATSKLKNPASAWLALIGRVRPGTNPKALQAQLQGELQQWLSSHIPEMTAQEKALLQKQTLHLTPGAAGISLMRANYQSGLRLLLAAAFCLLLLACANLANLLLARGLRNRRQTAVHVALGSPRGHLVRKALVECALLAVMGGTAGVGVAWAGARLILHLAYARSAQSIWIPVQASPSLPALLFALGISILTGLAFGVFPAWITSHAEPIEAMRGANRALGGNHHRVQKTLVIMQAALSVVLLSIAAMLGQSLRNRENQDLGFDPGGRYLVSIDPKLSNLPMNQLPLLFQQIESRLSAIPGVRSVGAVQEAPPGGWMTHEIRIEGQPQSGQMANFVSGWTRVTPGFFRTYEDRILMGRAITGQDTAATKPVAVVNEAFAKKFFGRQNPIGQHFGPVPERNAGMYEIVGVVRDVMFQGGLKHPMYFLPETQTTHFQSANSQSLEVWSHYLYAIVMWAPENPPDLERQVKQALDEVDPDLMMYGMRSYSEVIRDDFAQQNMIASLTWLFGALGLMLAALGIYGVTAYGAEQRTSEIGVRMALGANRTSVVAMMLREAFARVAIGLALGIPAAIGAGYLMASQLFGVRPWSPSLLGLATLLLGSAVFVAAWLPARSASRIDPMRALRTE